MAKLHQHRGAGVTIIQHLHLVQRLSSAMTGVDGRFPRGQVNDGLAGRGLQPTFPIGPVSIILDQEPDQHAGIHILDVNAPQSTGMARIRLFRTVSALWPIW